MLEPPYLDADSRSYYLRPGGWWADHLRLYGVPPVVRRALVRAEGSR